MARVEALPFDIGGGLDPTLSAGMRNSLGPKQVLCSNPIRIARGGRKLPRL
jgi:hypothetical protein